MQTKEDVEAALIEDIASFTHNPYGHVMYVYPWGEEGDLQEFQGPREWQKVFLIGLGEKLKAGSITPQGAIQEAVSSGHGIGKSALVAWLIKWALDTFEDTRCVVTANTESQLSTKTWPELSKWHRLSINSHWFVFTATALYSSDPNHEKNWRADMLPWSEHKTEAFAGLHNKGKRLVIIFDEASSIPPAIWEVTEGALTDENTEIMWFVFGNPTRNTGRFRECFGRNRHRWGNNQIDSRTVDGTNKIQIAKWIEDYGEDSDFVRIRVRGLFPRASSLQFIPSDLVAAAQKREVRRNKDDALIMTLDIARGGADNCVFRFRRGLDARSLPPIRIPGSEVRDSMILVSKAVELLKLLKPDAFFFDGTGVGGPVGDRIRQLGFNIIEVQFGSTQHGDDRYANMRAFMYAKLRDWLVAGGAIDDSPILETDLTSVEYTHKGPKDQLILEAKDHMRERGLASPDDGDALAMSFAYPVFPSTGFGERVGKLKSDYDPFDDQRE